MAIIVSREAYDKTIKTYINANIAKYKFYYIFFSIQLVLFVSNLFVSNLPYLFLNENQILYIYSTSAQVIAGLYGLTLTGYIFFNDKLSKLAENDESYYDVVEKLKGQYFRQIIVLGIGCILGIVMSLLTLNSLFNINSQNMYSFILNQTMITVLTEIVSIVLFSWSMANPRSIEKANQSLLRDNKYSREQKGNLEEFLKNYNSIENNIILLGEKFNFKEIVYNNYSNKNRRNFKPNIMSSLKILGSLNVIDEDLSNEINELRKYRNSIVHSDKPSVSKDAVEKTKSINMIINAIVSKYKKN